MATNYYAFITPTLERKRELVDLILVEKNYEKIVQEVVKTFGFYGVDIGGEPKATGGVIHLGRREKPGARFLWNPNIYFFNALKSKFDGAFEVHYTEVTPYMTYRLDKLGISTFINRPDLTVYNEYGEWQDKDEFLKMAFEFDDFDEEEAEKLYKANFADKIFIEEMRKLGYAIKDDSSLFYNDGLMFLASQNFR